MGEFYFPTYNLGDRYSQKPGDRWVAEEPVCECVLRSDDGILPLVIEGATATHLSIGLVCAEPLDRGQVARGRLERRRDERPPA